MLPNTTTTSDLRTHEGNPKLAPFFVWGVWALMLLAALTFVWSYGSNVPSWDDWDMVPTFTGHQPVTLSWLWSQHNEHRVPLPRIISLGLYRFIAHDFRVGMYFNVLVMGILACSMIFAAKRLRGFNSYADAFFPLLLLNWGQGLNFIWSWQLEFFTSTVLAGIVLLLIALSGTELSRRTALGIGICQVLLALCGAHGVALLPAIAVWLCCSAVLIIRSDKAQARRNGSLVLGMALLTLMLVPLYFIGYEKVPYHLSSPGWRATFMTCIQFLTMGFGPAVRSLWPLSGISMLCLLLLCSAILLIVVLRRPVERNRALGLFMFLGAMGSLALGLGLGRDGFEPRYITLSVPASLCIYFVLLIYAPPKVNHVLCFILFLITSLTLWPNTRFGLAYAKDLRLHLNAFEQDMAAGVPGYQLINQYGDYLHPHHDIPTDYMPMLRQAGVGYFRFLSEDPKHGETRLPLAPTELKEVRWEEGTAYSTGASPYLVFDLPEERYVSGVRLKYTYCNAEGTCPYVALYWKSSSQRDFTSDQYKKISPTGDRANWCSVTWARVGEPETTMDVWICDKVKQVRIHPDFKPGVFKISEIVLLVP